MLTYIKSAVTRNMSDKIINNLLDFVATAQDMELLLDFYSTTLSVAKEVKNDVCVCQCYYLLSYSLTLALASVVPNQPEAGLLVLGQEGLSEDSFAVAGVASVLQIGGRSGRPQEGNLID